MDKLVVLYFGLCIALGAGRWADLDLWTDHYTGLITSGTVWLRYAALAVVVLLGVVLGRGHAAKAQRLRGRTPLAGLLALVAAGSFVLAAVSGVVLAQGMFSASVIAGAVLELLSAAWLACVGYAWQSGGEWRAPTRSLLWGVLGSALFYWRVLACFMQNSSSWHRVTATSTVWQMMAALMFLSALARALYLPDAAEAKTLCASGFAAFALCFCWELPLLIVDGGGMELPEALFGCGVCAIGVLGGVCAALVSRDLS